MAMKITAFAFAATVGTVSGDSYGYHGTASFNDGRDFDWLRGSDADAPITLEKSGTGRNEPPSKRADERKKLIAKLIAKRLSEAEAAKPENQLRRFVETVEWSRSYTKKTIDRWTRDYLDVNPQQAFENAEQQVQYAAEWHFASTILAVLARVTDPEDGMTFEKVVPALDRCADRAMSDLASSSTSPVYNRARAALANVWYSRWMQDTSFRDSHREKLVGIVAEITGEDAGRAVPAALSILQGIAQPK